MFGALIKSRIALAKAQDAETESKALLGVEQAAFSAPSFDSLRRCLHFVRNGQLVLVGASDACLQIAKTRRMVAQTPPGPRLEALARLAFLRGLVRRVGEQAPTNHPAAAFDVPAFRDSGWPAGLLGSGGAAALVGSVTWPSPPPGNYTAAVWVQFRGPIESPHLSPNANAGRPSPQSTSSGASCGWVVTLLQVGDVGSDLGCAGVGSALAGGGAARGAGALGGGFSIQLVASAAQPFPNTSTTSMPAIPAPTTGEEADSNVEAEPSHRSRKQWTYGLRVVSASRHRAGLPLVVATTDTVAFSVPAFDFEEEEGKGTKANIPSSSSSFASEKGNAGPGWHLLTVAHSNRWLRGAPVEVCLNGQPLLSATLPYPNLTVLAFNNDASASLSSSSSSAVLTGLPEGGSRLPVACLSEGLACRIASIALYDQALHGPDAPLPPPTPPNAAAATTVTTTTIVVPPLSRDATSRSRMRDANTASASGGNSSSGGSSHSGGARKPEASSLASLPVALQALLEAGPRHPCLGFSPQAALAPLDSGGAFAGNNPVPRWPPRHSSEFQAVKHLGPRCVIAAFHSSWAEPLDDGSSSSQAFSGSSGSTSSPSSRSGSTSSSNSISNSNSTLGLRGLCPGWRPSGVSAGPQRLSLTPPCKQPLTLPASWPSLPSLSAEPPKHKPGAGSTGRPSTGSSSSSSSGSSATSGVAGSGPSSTSGANGAVGNNNGSALAAACFGGRGGGPPLPGALVQSRGALVDEGQRFLDALYAVGGVHSCLGLLAAACDEARVATAAVATVGASAAPATAPAAADVRSFEPASQQRSGAMASEEDEDKRGDPVPNGTAVAGALAVGVLELVAALLATGDERYRVEWAASHGFHAAGACLRSLPSGLLLLDSTGMVSSKRKGGDGTSRNSARSRGTGAGTLGLAITRACGKVLSAAHYARKLPAVTTLETATESVGGGSSAAAGTSTTAMDLVLPPDRIFAAACLHGLSLDCSLWGPRPLAGSQAPRSGMGKKKSSSSLRNGHSVAASTSTATATVITAATATAADSNTAAAATLRAPCLAFVLGAPWAVWAASLREAHCAARACPSQLLDSVGLQPLLDALADAVHSADPEMVAMNPPGNRPHHKNNGSPEGLSTTSRNNDSGADTDNHDINHDDDELDEEDGYAAVLRAAQPLLFVLLATALLRPLPAPLPRNAKAEAEFRANAAASAAKAAAAEASSASAAIGSSSSVANSLPRVLKVRGASGPHASYNDEWVLENPHDAHQGGKSSSNEGSSSSSGSTSSTSSGAAIMPRYVRKGNRKDVLMWDGARWTLNGSKYKGDRAAFWHSGLVDTSTTASASTTDTTTSITTAATAETAVQSANVAPWPPKSGWTAHPDWHGDLYIEGGFDLDAAAAAAAKSDGHDSSRSSGSNNLEGAGRDATAAAAGGSVPQAVANPRHPQVDRQLDALIRCLANAASPRPQKSRTSAATAAGAAPAEPLAAAADVVLRRRWLLCVALVEVLHALRVGEFVDRSSLDESPTNESIIASVSSSSPPSSDDGWHMSDGSSDERPKTHFHGQEERRQTHRILRISGSGGGILSLAARLRVELGRAAFLETVAPLIMAAEGWPFPSSLQAPSSANSTNPPATAATASKSMAAASLHSPDRAARLGCLDLCLWLIAPPPEAEQPLPSTSSETATLAAATAAAAVIPFTPLVPTGMRGNFLKHQLGREATAASGGDASGGSGNMQGATYFRGGEVAVAEGTWRSGRPLSHSPAAWSLADRHCKAQALGQAIADAVASGAWDHRIEKGLGRSSSSVPAAAAAAGAHRHGSYSRQKQQRNRSGDEFVGVVVARLLPDLTLPEPKHFASSTSRTSDHPCGSSSSFLATASMLDPPPPRWLGLTIAAGLLPHAPMSTKLAAAMGLTVLSKCELVAAVHASGVNHAAQSLKISSNKRDKASKSNHHKSGGHPATGGAIAPLVSIDGRPVYPTKAFDTLGQPLPPPPHAAVATSAAAVNAAAKAAAAAAAAESAWGAPGSIGGDSGFGSSLIHGQQLLQQGLVYVNARIGTDFLEAAAAALACVEMGVAEASRRGAARAKRKIAFHSSNNNNDAFSLPSSSKHTPASAAGASNTMTGSPPKLARRDSHLLPASVIAAAEASYWEDCDDDDDGAPSDDSIDELRDDGWLSVEGFGNGAVSTSAWEESETVEELSLDAAALLATELMLTEERGWQLWRTLAQRLAPKMTSAASSPITGGGGGGGGATSSAVGMIPIAAEAAVSAVSAAAASSVVVWAAESSAGGPGVLMKVLGLALQKLAAFTSSSWLPKETAATALASPPVQLSSPPSSPQQQQLRSPDASTGSSSSTSNLAAVAAASTLLKQRDASLSKLLGLIDEWQLLPCYSRGGGVEEPLSSPQVELVRAVVNTAAGLEQQVCARVSRARAAEKQASQAQIEAAARLRQAQTANKKKGHGGASGQTAAAGGGGTHRSAASSSSVLGSDFASISMAMQASLQVLLAVLPASCLTSTNNRSSGDEDDEEEGGFPAESQYPAVSSGVGSEVASNFLGAEVVLACRTVLFTMAETPGVGPSAVREAVLSTLLALRASMATLDAANSEDESSHPTEVRKGNAGTAEAATTESASTADDQVAPNLSIGGETEKTAFDTLAKVVLAPPLAPLDARISSRSACANLVVAIVEHFGKQFGNVRADTPVSDAAAHAASASTSTAAASAGRTTSTEDARVVPEGAAVLPGAGAASADVHDEQRSSAHDDGTGTRSSSNIDSPSSSSRTWVGSAVESARADALAAESKRRARAAAVSAAVSEERLALAAVRSQHVGEVLAPASKALVLWAANNASPRPHPSDSSPNSNENEAHYDEVALSALHQQHKQRAEVALAALLPRLNAAERLAAEERDELVDLFEATNMDEDDDSTLGRKGSLSNGSGSGSSIVAPNIVYLPQCMGGGLGTVQARRSALFGGVTSAAAPALGANMSIISSICGSSNNDSSGGTSSGSSGIGRRVAAAVVVPALSGTSRALRRQIAREEDVRRGVAQVVAAQQQHRTRLLAREIAVAASTEDCLPGSPLPSPLSTLPSSTAQSQLPSQALLPLRLLSTPATTPSSRDSSSGRVGLGWRLCEDFEGTWPGRRRIVLRPSATDTNPWDRVIATALLDGPSAHDDESGYYSSSGNLESAEASLDQSFVLDRPTSTVDGTSPTQQQQQQQGPVLSRSGSGESGSGADADAQAVALSEALVQLGYSARAKVNAASAAAGGGSEEWGLVGEKPNGELEVTDLTPETSPFSSSSSSSASSSNEDAQSTAAAHAAVAQALHQNEDDDNDDNDMVGDSNAAGGATGTSNAFAAIGGTSSSGSGSICGSAEAHLGADDALLSPSSVTVSYGPLAGPPAPRINPGDTTSGVAVTMVTPAALYRGELVLASGQRLCFTPEADPSILTRKAAAAAASREGGSQGDSSGCSGNNSSEPEEGRRWPRRERWQLRLLDGCFLRRYRLRDTALELFFASSSSGSEGDPHQSPLRVVLFDFGARTSDGVAKRDAFARKIMACAPQAATCEWPAPPLQGSGHSSGHRDDRHYQQAPSPLGGGGGASAGGGGGAAPDRDASAAAARQWHKNVTEWTAKWQRREVSNFEYLMALNTFAGRSFNDLCQYPVFPWVLNDYRTKAEALHDARTAAVESAAAAESGVNKESEAAVEPKVATAAAAAANGTAAKTTETLPGRTDAPLHNAASESSSSSTSSSSSSISTSPMDADAAYAVEWSRRRAERGAPLLLSDPLGSGGGDDSASSCRLDLSDPTLFRDLSKPMGALDPTRLATFRERYASLLEQDSVPPFMYGSHYSTAAGCCLHYLVRLEPFASLHRDLQGGKFDVADRLFRSVSGSWHVCVDEGSEVKELTPEWYSTPSFLRNLNALPLGKTQTGEVVNDVELPYWCSSPEDFIAQHAAALESDHVSAHLHEWIDLIFGAKQRGPAAVTADNVFYYLTYYGMVDISEIEDPIMRLATETQIAHFGQCPRQLFRSPHPSRGAKGLSGPRVHGLHRRFTPRLLDLAPQPLPPIPPLAQLSAAASAGAAAAAATTLSTSLSSLTTASTQRLNLRPLVPPHAPHIRIPSPRYVASSSSNPGSIAGWFDASVGVAALRLANGVCVCVDGRGIIDVLHWTMVDPTPMENDDMDDDNTNNLHVPAGFNVRASQHHHRSSVEMQPLSSSSSSSGGEFSTARRGEIGGGVKNPLRSEVHVESTESDGVHDSGSFDSTAAPAGTTGGGHSSSSSSSSSGAEMIRAELTCWRLEPPFDEMPRLPPGHCPPPLDHSRVAGLTSSGTSARSPPQSVKKANDAIGSSSGSSSGGGVGTHGGSTRRNEGLLAGVSSGVVCCISATGRFVVSGGCQGSLAVQQLDLTSGLVCGELSLPRAHSGPVTFVAMAHLELTRGCGEDGGVSDGIGSSSGGASSTSLTTWHGGYSSEHATQPRGGPRGHDGGGGEGSASDRKLRAVGGSGGFDDLVFTGGADGVAKLWKLRLVDNKKGGSAILAVRPWRVFRGHCISGLGGHMNARHSSANHPRHSGGGVQAGAVSSELGVCVVCSGGVALSYALRGHSGVLRRFHATPLEAAAGSETTSMEAKEKTKEKANDKASTKESSGAETIDTSTTDERPPPPPPPPPQRSPASSPSLSLSAGAPLLEAKIWQLALSSSLGLLAFYFTTTTTTTSSSTGSSASHASSSAGLEVRHWLQVHSINGGCPGDCAYSGDSHLTSNRASNGNNNNNNNSSNRNTTSGHSAQIPCVAEIELDYACTSLRFVGSGAVLSLTTRNGRLELLRATDLRPLSAVNLLQPNAAPTAAAAAAAAAASAATTTAATASDGASTTRMGATGATGGTAAATPPLAVPSPPAPTRFEVVLAMGGVPAECASCVDWAPDPSRPALFAWGDGTGAVHLVGLADLEDWAKHMPISHHRNGLRQAVHSVAGGLRSQAGRLGGTVKGAAVGAFSEAKYLVRDAKDSALVKGVLGFFGRG